MVGELGWMVGEPGQNGWRTRPEWSGARPGRFENWARVLGELGQNGWRTRPEWLGNKARMVDAESTEKVKIW